MQWARKALLCKDQERPKGKGTDYEDFWGKAFGADAAENARALRQELA